MNILITGASKGIGAELALQLAEEHHNLFLIARSQEKLMKVSQKCNAKSGRNLAIPIVYNLNDILKKNNGFITTLSKHTDVIDILVNNAATLLNKSFEEITIEESKQVFDTNYFVPEQLIKSCLPFLLKSNAASIINVCSMAAVQGSSKFSGLTAYSASKGALSTLTECLAVEFKAYNIKVNALAFGSVQTEMLQKAFPGINAKTSPAEMGRFFKWFVLEGWKRFNGKLIPVSDSTP